MMNRFKIQDLRFRNGTLISILILTSYFLLPTSIHAQSVDILWQGDTYTPPFYQGRTLWSKQSQINFVAITNGLGNPASLIYKWTKNGTVLGNVSGVGRNSLAFLDTIFSKPQTVKIEVYPADDDELLLANAVVFLTPVAPTLAIYENNPLYGFMFHRETVGSYNLKEKEVTFAAFPFFFANANRADNSISYEWRTNTGEVETQNSVTYRTPDDAVGSSQVSLRASNANQIMQSISKSFLVQFGENNER